jgi:hypothetical protein
VTAPSCQPSQRGRWTWAQQCRMLRQVDTPSALRVAHPPVSAPCARRRAPSARARLGRAPPAPGARTGSRGWPDPTLTPACMAAQAGGVAEAELRGALLGRLPAGARLHAVVDACAGELSLGLPARTTTRPDSWAEWQARARRAGRLTLSHAPPALGHSPRQRAHAVAGGMAQGPRCVCRSASPEMRRRLVTEGPPGSPSGPLRVSHDARRLGI